ncbi:amino acid ABC transporter ATP-binding protein [Thermococcus gammatolerans]|uniref:ABC-type amino acid transport system, ATPase component n=1 Tax=Thermococcus gammatolerans (strain DSM 15229 / JCM 11827 / EJ3) TaxID=593117 RepID=C5A2U3_THEGJ|nr:amino acid ABC transporter ATP-binding protein [Thermococcus gammatolerans]ACS32595.1 ABC-type amino acid transport system, ATPase component [Thermococcus gammatolerans EJ3]
MSDSDRVLIIRNLTKRFGEKPVLKGISFEVERGETKVIIGPSGAGKSTLLRCINRLIEPDGGEIIFNGTNILERGVDIRKIRAKIGFVFQHFNLFKHLTALENVKIGLKVVRGMSDEEAEKKAIKALRMVHLEEDAFHKYPAQLSGGQQQRVAIARALAMEPEIILFDEPTSALDPQLAGEVLDVMRELAKKKVTMLVVTHEIGFALNAADEVLFFYDGVIWEKGKPEEILYNPKRKETREFLKRIADLSVGGP